MSYYCIEICMVKSFFRTVRCRNVIRLYYADANKVSFIIYIINKLFLDMRIHLKNTRNNLCKTRRFIEFTRVSS